MAWLYFLTVPPSTCRTSSSLVVLFYGDMIPRRLASSAAALKKAKPKLTRHTVKQRWALEHGRILAERIASGSDEGPGEPPAPADSTQAVSHNDPPTSNSAITLETLATYRPTRPPPTHGSIERYTREYKRAFARLDKAFLRPQLLELWEASVHEHARASSGSVEASDGGSDVKPMKKLGPKPGKGQIVAALLESWGWPRIEVVEREKQAAAWGNVVVEKGELR